MKVTNNSFLKILSDDSLALNPEKDLTNLTIVIPTFERPAYLLRQIAYLSKWKTRVEIIDGSVQPLDNELIQLIERFPHINYQHCCASLTERMSLVCEKIKTTYAMCLADDDFYLPSGVLSAINALDSDKNAVACMGQSLGFDRFYQSYYLFNYGSSLRNYSVNDLSAKTRINKGIENYRSASPYAVFRVHAFLKVWEKRELMSCLEAVEYEHAIRTYLCGGVITTPDIYWLRSFETQPIASTIDGNRAIDFAKWDNDIKFNQERECFESRMIGIFLEEGSMTKNEADALYKQIIRLILAKSHVGLTDKTIMASIIESFMKLVNPILFNNLRSLKKTGTWQAIRDFGLYLSRKKVTKPCIGNSEMWSELNNVLEFAHLFTISTDK